MDQLQIAHRPHDARLTFATMMAKAKADKLCVKCIMGHAAMDITESVYTYP
jgi:Site-specific recombinase XerD